MRLHIVDGTYELFRAHFSPRPPHQDPQGRDNKATVGVAMSLLGLLQEADEAVTHLAVAFDNPIRSFRNRLFDGYKTDEGVPPELLAQFDPVEEATRALGITVWSMDEFEADDAMAAGAARFCSQVEQVRLMTPDKDMGQCLVRPNVVQVDRRQKKSWDGQGLKARWGFGPESVPDFLALVGDTADGIPGLKGFGEKTTAALLSKYPHLEDIPDQASRWEVKVRGADALAATLASGREAARLYRTLATLRVDVPLEEDLAALEFRGVPRASFDAFCEKAGSQTLRGMVKRFA
jgi:5'-3' exonuclease